MEQHPETTITVTLPASQARALIDAANCLADCAENNLSNVLEAWMPTAGPDQRSANAYLLEMAEAAQAGAAVLRGPTEQAEISSPEGQAALELLERMRQGRKAT